MWVQYLQDMRNEQSIQSYQRKPRVPLAGRYPNFGTNAEK